MLERIVDERTPSFVKMMATECAGCLRPILDRFLLYFLDKTWHSNCVKCQLCRKLLDEKCFYKEGKIYCHDDFYRCFGTKCGGCGDGIHPTDFVRKARNKVYHLRCFTCSLCSKQLSTGEVLYLSPGDDSFVCKDDYLKTHQADSLFSDDEEDVDDHVTIPGLDAHPTPPHSTPDSTHSLTPTPSNVKLENNNSILDHHHQQHPHHLHHSMKDMTGLGGPVVGGSHHEMMSLKDETESVDGDPDGEKDADNKSPGDDDGPGGKRRGPRTTIKAKQLEILKTAFSQTPKPTRHIREQLAKETGLTMRVIQVWFQNKRSKERRMKQMTNGMIPGRGFFPGKGGRRGFPIMGDDFGYFPQEKAFHDFGYPNFPGGPAAGDFFPGGPVGFMGPHPGGNMDQPLPMHGPPPPPPHIQQPPHQQPSSMNSNPSSQSVSSASPTRMTEFPNQQTTSTTSTTTPSSTSSTASTTSTTTTTTTGDVQPNNRPSPDFQSNNAGNNFSSEQQSMSEQMVW